MILRKSFGCGEGKSKMWPFNKFSSREYLDCLKLIERVSLEVKDLTNQVVKLESYVTLYKKQINAIKQKNMAKMEDEGGDENDTLSELRKAFGGDLPIEYQNRKL